MKQKPDKKRKLENEEKVEERSQERKLLQQMGRAITATTTALFVFMVEEMKMRKDPLRALEGEDL